MKLYVFVIICLDGYCVYMIMMIIGLCVHDNDDNLSGCILCVHIVAVDTVADIVVYRMSSSLSSHVVLP